MAILDSLIGIFFVIGGGTFLFYGICFVCKNERKKWQKRFNEINIGDKFIQKLNQPDPFKPQYSQIVTISDKTMNADGDCYLKYKIKQYINVYSSCTIQDFFDFYHYVPYTNQDKEQ